MTAPLAWLEALEPTSIRLGLERMERALDALGRPDRALRVLHVAGTNGKGSTCAMAAAALRAAGLDVGLYTSPHLERFNERIAVNGEPIDDAPLADALDAVRAACPWHERGEDRLTYFEAATLAALLHFARRGVQAAVVEVGLGGRLDATNVVRPLACAVTRIGLDHVEWLGSTLDAIAREKAGILKPGVPAVTTPGQPPEALAALRDEARARGVALELAAAGWDGGPVGLAGPHQQENAALAAAALRLLARAGVPVTEEAIREGIATARWPGRLEEIGGVLLDGAHNADGAAALAAALPVVRPGAPVELVFGLLADKDAAGVLDALAPAVRALHVVAPPSPRARGAEALAGAARARGIAAHPHATLPEALACARAAAGAGGCVCVAGSLYLVGAARTLLRAGAPGAPRVP